MKPFFPLVLILAVSIPIFAPPLYPQADYVGFSLDYMMTHADFIVVGNTYGVVENDTIATYHLMRFAVERYYKGDGPQLIDIRIEGSPGYWVEDQPELIVGASYLLFLRADSGFIYLYGGRSGAARIEGGVASNGQFALKVTDSGFAKVLGRYVTATGFRNNTDLIVHDPAWLVIWYDNAGPTPGYWTFHVRFDGISGDASGKVELDEPSGFLPFPRDGVFSFYHNFTAPGSYRVSIDGRGVCDIYVGPPHEQVPLVGISTPDEIMSGEDVVVKASAGKSTVTGELKALLVVTSRGGMPAFYPSYTKCYEGYPNEFEFRVAFPKGGDYILTLWQNGVRQLSKEVSVMGVTTERPGESVQAENALIIKPVIGYVQLQDTISWLTALLTIAGLLLLMLEK